MIIHGLSTSAAVLTAPLAGASSTSVLSPVTMLTGACYLTIACVLARRWWAFYPRHPQPEVPNRRDNVWFALALAVALLGLNELAAALEHIAEFGRRLAESSGWYDHRRPLQALISAGLGLMILLLAAQVLRTVRAGRGGRRVNRRRACATSLISALAAFVLVRSISLHHIDAVLNLRLGILPLHRLAEITLLALVGLLCVLPRRVPRLDGAKPSAADSESPRSQGQS